MKTDGIERLGFLIHDAARLMRRCFEQRGSEYGLSAAQARLAELLEIEPISVSRLLDRMEEGGWIERRQATADRRVRMIFPTDKARDAFAKVKAVAGEVYELALAGLSQEERLAMVHGLRTIIGNLAAHEAGEANCTRETKK